jgi:hypothetical protein
MKPRHLCRASAARADLRKRQVARHIAARAAGRAAPPMPADLRCRAGGTLTADDGGRRTHGVEADRGLAVRRMRETARHRHPRVLARPATPPQDQAGEPGYLGVRDVRESPRAVAHLPAANRFQGTETEGRYGRAAPQAAGRQGTAGCQAEAGRRRAPCPCPRPEEGRQERNAPAAPARRGARAGDLRGPRLPEVRLRRLLARHGRLSRPARRLGDRPCSRSS